MNTDNLESRLAESFERASASIQEGPQLVTRPKSGRSGTLKMVAAATLAGVVLFGSTSLFSQNQGVGDEPVAGSTIAAEAELFLWHDGSHSAATNCIAEADPTSLAQRDFVLVGTVEDVAATNLDNPQDAGESQRLTATVIVETWLSGGGSTRARVMFQRAVAPGDRLLVAGASTGAGLLAWECGFTRDHSQAGEDAWRSAFAR